MSIKGKLLAFSTAVGSLFTTTPALAHCPLCSAATGALVVSSRVAGVDDVITGTFLGAFTIATALWMDKIISKKWKGFNIPFRQHTISLISFALTVAALFWTGLLGTGSILFGLERLLFGLVLGSVITIFSFQFHGVLRKWNGGKNHFPLQGVALPIFILFATNAALYLMGIV